jgi:hypothetical protein
MRSAKLPSALVWQDGGHLTEEALAALADDEDILPEDATAHALACEDCGRRMGEAAILSVELGASLAGVMAEAPANALASQAQKPATPTPLWALVFGLGFVGVGAVPFLLGIPSSLPRAVLVLQRSVPVFAHGLVSALAGLGGDAVSRVMVSLVSLAVLMMSAFAVSRLTPREGVAQ